MGLKIVFKTFEKNMYFEKSESGIKIKNESNSHIYEIESKIGQGAYGKVYRVSRVDDTRGKQEYVIKNIKLNSF